MVALPVPLKPHCSQLFQQVYFTGYDFASEVEKPVTYRNEMSGQYQYTEFVDQKQANFDLFSPPVPMTAYPSPALTNTVPIITPYQINSECGMGTSYGLGVARSVQTWHPTGVTFPSPHSQLLPLASSPQFVHGLPSPSPHQPAHQMLPIASTKRTLSKRPDRSFSCSECPSTFTRLADVKRHMSSVHNPVPVDCPYPACSRKGRMGFPRRDHMVEHLRSYHRHPVPKRVFNTGATRVMKRQK